MILACTTLCQCSTNFNADANFVVFDKVEADKSTGSTAPMAEKADEVTPRAVEFGDGADGFHSVDVYVPVGSYEFGKLVLEDDLVLTFDEDDVTLVLNEEATGPVTTFVAGPSNALFRCMRAGSLRQPP